MKKIGIYNPYIETKGGGEKMSLALAETLAEDKNNDVFLITHSEVKLELLADYFKLDLTRVKSFKINTDTVFLKIIRRLHLPSMAQHFFFDIVAQRTLKKKNFDVFINNCYHSNLPSPTSNGVYLCMFPQKLENDDKSIGLLKKIYLVCMHALNRIAMHPKEKYSVHTYKFIISISEFTKSHVQKLWGRDSTILYPICEDMLLKNPPEKEKIILHVGRFFENAGNNHHKRQDILLEAFTKLTQLQKDGWQLHFVGSVAEEVGALKYLIKLMKKSQGLPVYFHFNCSFPELKDLYNKATIYWHATGFGSDPEKQPERQEHFGISTVEAMSTGAIPVVINTAGQKESVIHGQNGFLWSTKKELAEYTTRVAKLSSDQLKPIQSAAIKSAARFNKTAFEKRVDTIFGEILH